jgi:hypothetical protein
MAEDRGRQEERGGLRTEEDWSREEVRGLGKTGGERRAEDR